MMQTICPGERKSASQTILRSLLVASLVLATCILLISSSEEYLNYLAEEVSQVYDGQPNNVGRENIQPSSDTQATSEIPERFVWIDLVAEWTLDRRNNNRERPPLAGSTNRYCVWPGEGCQGTSQDRIIEQLQANRKTDKIYSILPHDMSAFPEGQEIFLRERCSINNCRITYDQGDADVLIFQNSDVHNEPPKWRRMSQIWIAYLLESPVHTFDRKFKRKSRGKHEFNWTATYRADSDIVTPYSKFVPYLDQLDKYELLKKYSQTQATITTQEREHQENFYKITSVSQKRFISNKKGKVAWLASNCNAANNRLEYARELSKFVQVDIYGRCGDRTCHKWNQTGCLEMINREYKFYLSFENSNCPLYVSEKLYNNALGYNDLNHLVVPIVMGPSKSDYELLAPPSSFIHVDDFESPKELANFLKLLDGDDALYNYYFAWKTVGRFIDTKFMCRICALANDSELSARKRSYPDIESWWASYTDPGGSVSSCIA